MKVKKYLRFAILLIVYLIPQFIFAQIAEPSNANDDIFAKLGKENDDKSKRTRTTKHYKMPDGTYKAIITAGESLHYFSDGKWKDIDEKIYPDNQLSGFDYANTGNCFKSYYASDNKKGIKTVFDEGEITEWKNVRFVWVDANGNEVGKTMADNSIGKVIHKSISYFSLFNNISAEITQGSDGRKIDYTLHSNSIISNRPASAASLLIFETIEIPAGWNIEQEKLFNRQSNSDEVISVTLSDGTGKQIIKYQRPFYYEKQVAPNKKHHSLRGSYQLTKEGNNLHIGTIIPVSWLKDSLRTFPVVIDPTATVYPSNLSRWSTSVYRRDDDGSLYLQDTYIDVGWYDIGWPSSNERSHAYCKYDITSIPDAAQIVRRYVRLTAYDYGNGGGSTTINFGSYGGNTTDPVPRTTSQVYSDIVSGSTYLTSTTFSGGVATYTIGPSTSYNADIEAKLASNWYAMSFYCVNTGTGGGWGDDSYYYFFYGHTQADIAKKPALIIDYCNVHPTASAGTDQSICNTSSAIMAANAPGGGQTGQWSIVSGCSSCTFTNSTSNTTTVNNIPQGTNVLRWTVTLTTNDGYDNGSGPQPCTCAASDDIIITNNTPTTPNAGTDITTCQSTYILGGNYPVIGTGTWTVVGGAGTFSNNNLYNATVSNMNAGANTYQWSISYNGCTHASPDQVIITSNSIPTATITTPASSPWNLCVDNMAIVANNPAPNTGQWSVISGSGTFADASAFTTTVSGLASGNNTIRWTVTASGIGCTNQVNVTLTNNGPTTANAGPDQTTSTTSATMQANTPTIGTGAWTCTANCGGITIVTPTSPTTQITGISGTHTFQWCITVGGCASSCDQVNVYYDPNELGLIITRNLINSGTFTHTDDPNYFIMNGTGDIDGTNGTYNDAKLRVKGTITFKGSISSGKLTKTWINGTKSLTINAGKTYKNNWFSNDGTLTLNNSSIFENSGDWLNNSTVSWSDNTPIVKFNGTGNLQTVKTNSATNEFKNIVFDNKDGSNVPGHIALTDDMPIAVSGTFTNGIVKTVATWAQKVIFKDGATAGSAITDFNNNSFVRGTVKKIGNDNFIFPVGFYRSATVKTCAPIGIDNTGTGSDITDEYTVEYSRTWGTGFPPVPQIWLDSVALGIPGYTSAFMDVSSSPVLDHISRQEFWEVTKSASSEYRPVTLYSLDLVFSGITQADISDVQAAHYLTGISKWENQYGSFVITDATGNGKGYITSTGTFSSYSPITFGSKTGKNPLPVDLLSFTAQCINSSIQLDWSTASEINNSHYVIEKSFDTQQWFEVAKVTGSGNTNELKKYQYFDKADLSDKDIYYRLTQVDLDGLTKEFNVVSLICHENQLQESYAIYPNPAKDDLYISVQSAKPNIGLITLTNELGQKIDIANLILVKGNNELTINISKLASGVYYISIILDNSVYPVKKFVISR